MGAPEKDAGEKRLTPFLDKAQTRGVGCQAGAPALRGLRVNSAAPYMSWTQAAPSRMEWHHTDWRTASEVRATCDDGPWGTRA